MRPWPRVAVAADRAGAGGQGDGLAGGTCLARGYLNLSELVRKNESTDLAYEAPHSEQAHVQAQSDEKKTPE
jgi:hypothetical protein